jgi:S-DNA-T family DNA segregation ATPase FtsK/SpoIIIE
VLGQLVARVLETGFGAMGATLFLLALLLVAVTLGFGISWFRVMDRIGAGTLWLFGAFGRSLRGAQDWNQGRRARVEREETRKVEIVRQQKREPIKIEPKLEPIERSERATRELQIPLFAALPEGTLPPLSLLDEPKQQVKGYSPETLEALSRQVELKLKDFRIDAQVVGVYPGPVITRFELQPAPGIKGSQISNLDKDIARGLSVVSVRVVDVIPGKSVIGLEIPNANRETVYLSEILRSKEYDKLGSPLALALGKDIGGRPTVVDLSKMPHLLVAGTTGSGKSVALNAMVLSLLYKASARDVRMLMIDPKMLELSVYQGIPHLLAPVVTDMKEAANALRWCVAEMERRYKLMAAIGVRNLAGFNRKVKDARDAGHPLLDPLFVPREDEPGGHAQPLETLPYLVVLIDEFADMMLIVGKKVEELITRLAQKARAAGIHLILATQRPSVDVITGLIKANIPTRIAFQVSSKIDSRTILDQSGAETLLGHGDMLYLPPGTATPERVHGAFVSDDEVHRVVRHLKSHQGQPDYIDGVLDEVQSLGDGTVVGPTGLPEEREPGEGEVDELYDMAVKIVTETRRASISGVQRRLKIGYNRAARLIEEMEAAGIVSAPQHNGNREVLAPPPPKA